MILSVSTDWLDLGYRYEEDGAVEDGDGSETGDAGGEGLPPSFNRMHPLMAIDKKR